MKRVSIVRGFCLAAAWVLLAASGPAVLASPEVSSGDIAVLERTGKAFSNVAKTAIPGVVYVYVERSVTVGGMGRGPRGYEDPSERFDEDFFRQFFGYSHPAVPSPRQFKQMGQGSGFIISKDGYILTNNHVIGDMDKITVRLHDGREFEAELVGTDPHSEVAVIKIDADNLPYVPLGDSDDLEIGEWVIAVGTPFGLSETLTVGVVSAKGRSNIGIADYENFIQTDAAINPGNSGGPLLNIKGEAVGVNTAIFSRSGGYMGIGFAIPINMARKIKEQLVETGKVERGYIGIVIQDMTPDLAESFGVEEPNGILVARVAEDSAGEKAGLEQGDIILELDGNEVGDVGAFRNNVASTLPGTVIALKILRDNRRRDIDVKIGSLDELTGARAAPTDLAEKMGMAVDNLTPELARRFGYEPDSGVMVTRVEAGSPAEQVGIEPGHLISSVNRVPVTSVEEFEQALARSKNTDMVLLLVSDGQYSRFVTVAIE